MQINWLWALLTSWVWSISSNQLAKWTPKIFKYHWQNATQTCRGLAYVFLPPTQPLGTSSVVHYLHRFERFGKSHRAILRNPRRWKSVNAEFVMKPESLAGALISTKVSYSNAGPWKINTIFCQSIEVISTKFFPQGSVKLK